MYPSREEFTELIYYISELKHQYGSKIDEQTIKINDQSGVIEELLWQIRELSDKIRQMNNKVMDLEKTLFESRRKSEDKYCVCRYENHIPRRHNRSVFSRHASTISRRDTHKIIMKQGANYCANHLSMFRYQLFFVQFQLIKLSMMMEMMYTKTLSSVIHRTCTQSLSEITEY